MPRKKREVKEEEVAVAEAATATPTVTEETQPEPTEEIEEDLATQPEQHAYFRGEQCLHVMLKELNGRQMYEVKTNTQTSLLTKEEKEKQVTYR